MAWNYNSLTTGLLGYSLKKDFLSEGLYYREVETYKYEIFSRPTSTPGLLAYNEIQNNVKTAFALYSGDITVKVLDSPSDYTFPNDGIRLSKFNVEVEIRKTGTVLNVAETELDSNYYKGLDTTFFTNYSTILNDFKEDFSFETSENGNGVFGHNLAFSLRTGTKDKATEIAKYIYAQDKDTTFGIATLAGQVSTLGNSGTYVSYYSESYDLIRSNYSFSRKREILPLLDTNYTYELTHVLNFKEDGIIDVAEKGAIQGKMSFNDALVGLSILYPNAYTRCNGVYNSYKNISAAATLTAAETLVNLVLISSKVYNKLNFSVDYDVSFTNNPSIDAANFVSLEKILDVELNENKFLNINHSYNYNYLGLPIASNDDSTYITLINSAYTNSPIEVASYYNNFEHSRSLNQIKISSTLPNRKKSFKIEFNYTNNPIYFITIDGVTYSELQVKISETKPVDILNEYKIINRPTKTSIINYAYQTERGVRSVDIIAKLARGANRFVTPISDLETKLLSLYKYGISKLMETFFGIQTLSLTYFLSDIKYQLNSDNELQINMGITYTIKKYIA